jgi:hypothetical protein
MLVIYWSLVLINMSARPIEAIQFMRHLSFTGEIQLLIPKDKK